MEMLSYTGLSTSGHAALQVEDLTAEFPKVEIDRHVTWLDGAFCPIPSAELLQRRLRNGGYRLEDLGLEKYCSRCDDYWPADTEFFYPALAEKSGLNDWCKACYREWRVARNNKAIARAVAP